MFILSGTLSRKELEYVQEHIQEYIALAIRAIL